MSKEISKIQIVAFTTNEDDLIPNDIFTKFLESNNHKIGKKVEGAIGFTLTLPKETKPTKIVICSITNLEQEYEGIKDVNCYIVFIDLETEKTKEKINEILHYAEKNCELDKRVYVLGIKKEGNDNKSAKKIKKKDIINPLDDIENIDYEYKEFNLDNTKDMNDILIEIFEFCSQDLSKEKVTEQKEGSNHNSCNIL